MPRRKSPERDLQGVICATLKLALPDDAICLACPGGDRKVTLTPGYIPGTPDLQVIWRGLTLFMELKSKAGRLSPEQKRMSKTLERSGAPVHVVRSLGQALFILRDWGVPLKISERSLHQLIDEASRAAANPRATLARSQTGE